MKRLAAIDDTLERLGTPKTYRKMHIYSKQVVIGWIVFSIITNFDSLAYYTLLNTELEITWILLRAYVQNHCFNINAFVDFLFIFFLWLVFICIHIWSSNNQKYI